MANTLVFITQSDPNNHRTRLRFEFEDEKTANRFADAATKAYDVQNIRVFTEIGE